MAPAHEDERALEESGCQRRGILTKRRCVEGPRLLCWQRRQAEGAGRAQIIGTRSTNAEMLAGASGQLIAARSYAPQAVPAFTYVLLTLLLSSWMPFPCPYPVHKECLRTCWCKLVSLASPCLQPSVMWPSDVHRWLK